MQKIQQADALGLRFLGQEDGILLSLKALLQTDPPKGPSFGRASSVSSHSFPFSSSSSGDSVCQGVFRSRHSLPITGPHRPSRPR